MERRLGEKAVEIGGGHRLGDGLRDQLEELREEVELNASIVEAVREREVRPAVMRIQELERTLRERPAAGAEVRRLGQRLAALERRVSRAGEGRGADATLSKLAPRVDQVERAAVTLANRVWALHEALERAGVTVAFRE